MLYISFTGELSRFKGTYVGHWRQSKVERKGRFLLYKVILLV